MPRMVTLRNFRRYPGTLPDPELPDWPFHSESICLEIGVVPRLLINWDSTSHALRSLLRLFAERSQIKGSLLQNGFCTNFSDFEAKIFSPKNAPKNVPKNAEKKTPKNGMFSPIFSTEFFPEFSVCVFLQ